MILFEISEVTFTKDLQKNLKIAIQNASRDIYERINSKEKNFVNVDGKMIFYGIIRWIFGNKKEE